MTARALIRKAPKFDRGFRFHRPALNRRLVIALFEAATPFAISPEGDILFRSEDEAAFEDALAGVRDTVLPSWQVLMFPTECEAAYRGEIRRRKVRFLEERLNGRTVFVIPRDEKPMDWDLDSD